MFICMFEAADILDGLNDQQRRAATHQGGPLLVLAGAGTGKTRTLVARAGWLREPGHAGQPDPAADVHPPGRGRHAGPGRVRAGQAPAERVGGGTFHAVAHQIIRQHAESFSLPPQFTVIDPADATNLMDTLRPENGLASRRSGRRGPGTCADIYTRCVNTGRRSARWSRRSSRGAARSPAELAGLFRAYTARKRAARHLVDFDDLLLLWRAALADAAAGPVLRGMFDAVLVDEYQDVNAVQASIVRLLRPDGQQPDLRGRRRAGHLRLPRRRPGAPARAGRGLPGPRCRPAGPQLPVQGGGAGPGQPHPAVSAGPGAGADRRPRARDPRRCWSAATTRRPRPGRSAPGCWRPRGRRGLRDQAVLVRAAQHSDMLEIELSARARSRT